MDQEEVANKLKERSLKTCSNSDISDKVFTESLEEPDCFNILFSCIKNVENQKTQTFENSEEMKEGQIKGEKQLAELSSKFDGYEKDTKKRKKE